MMDLRDLGNPTDFWEYFEKISKIPRCSGEEEKVREFIKNQAEMMSYETLVDKGGNLLIRIPSKSKANNSKIILQCHMDMVCEKNEKYTHDFSKDSLKLLLVEKDNKKWLTAEGTTLGADNGVGIAYLLTLMKKINQGELELGPLDLLFTVDEEIGLVGAINLESGLIDGKYLLNLDSEDDNRFTIGCAGGINTIATINVEFIEEAACVNRNMPLYVVHLAEETLKLRNKNLHDSSFAVLGVTYKRDVLDIRRAPSKAVINELTKASENVMVFDPLTDEAFGAKSGSLEETINGKDCIILVVNHSYFREKNIEDKINELAPNCCLIDTRNFVDSTKLKKSILYRCLGKPLKSG